MTDDKTPEESPLDPGESIAGGEAIVEGAPGATAPGAGGAAANAEAGAPDAAATDAGGVAGPDDEPIDPLAVLRDELTAVREQLAAAQAETAAMKDQALRALAEVENQRRRHQRDKIETQKYAGSVLAKDMLTVADNLERALANIPTEALETDAMLKALYEGVDATARELAAVLERHQVRRIEPLGEKFDSHRHQAMFEIETTEYAPGMVAQVLQPGYVMHDERLLRPALVGVAKAPAQAAPNSTT